MIFRVLFSVSLFVLFLIVPAPGAQAQSAAEVSTMVARMQAIIQQMEKLQSEFQSLASQLGASTGSGAVLGASSEEEPVFTEPLEYGETNDDIARIQKLLATDPEIYPYGVVSGFFGPKTQEAIRNLQGRFGLKQVGVIGPQTTALLSGYMRAYPNENYPDGVLSTKPTVLGASTGNPSAPSSPSALSNPTITNNPASSITVEFDGSAADITIRYRDGDRESFLLRARNEDEAVAMIVKHTDLTTAQVRAAMSVESADDEGPSNTDRDEAEEAIDDADDAIEDAEDEIDEEHDDGEDTDWAEETLEDAEDLLDEAEEAYDDGDYDEAIDLAEEAEDLAKDAEDRIGKEEGEEKGDPDEIEEIIAKIGSDETEITVEYEDDPDYEFEIDETDEDDIIEEVADELDIDEDEVEDLIEFEGMDVELIDAAIYEDDDRTIVDVEFENGDEKRYIFDTTDEDEIIEELADRLNLDEDDIEDVIRFSD